MRIPISTYRLQISSRFTLFDAAEIVDYVSALGCDWLYLSPLLSAEPGSNHGYDVVDHSSIDAARGGIEGLKRLSAAARAAGLGILVDIVPNHMGVQTPRANRWWWDLLENGRSSRYAEAFDVDWDFGRGRLRLPILGGAGDEHLDALALVPGAAGATELAYYEHRFPIAPGTADDGASPRSVHDRQHYELIHWREADAQLNYRRFFAVTTLAGIRVEVPWVFAESHAEIGRWFADSLVDGLRVDHPDGLADPGAYLDDLSGLTGGAYVLVEKILEGREPLSLGWKTVGATGYNALADFDRVLVDAAGEALLDGELELGPQSPLENWLELIHVTKRSIATGILRSEVLRIQRDLDRDSALPAELTASPRVEVALVELLAAFPVYRSYLPLGAEFLDLAEAEALGRRPELATEIKALAKALANPANSGAIRFQQTSGMIMAKGVEDTAFYRWNRLVSLNEVGAQPSEFAIPVAEFHERQRRRLAARPLSMTTLSTHDTKRGEDVRARIDALAELAPEWTETLAALRALAPIGDRPLESLLWQSVVGAWPIERERVHAYAEKAAREAGDSTAWTAVNQTFETRLHAAVDAVYDNAAARSVIEGFVELADAAGHSNSMAAKLTQLTTVGVPDVYAGTELFTNSLVDPDNRRPVDYDVRRALLAELDDGRMPDGADPALKLFVTSRALRLRRDRPELFTGYESVAATGSAAGHVIAFDRGGAVTVATRLPIGLERSGGWGDTHVVLAQNSVDVLTGIRYSAGEVALSRLLGRYPVALLAGIEPTPAGTNPTQTATA